ncbi:hypothetical protein LFM09_29180 [Lentzea alba]|uniref:hypothetical protein n=1 Tax=Lentzea alba TaxID=2714351 RepID=UPI0039BEFF9B
MEPAIKLAADLECPLLVLCSGWSSAAEVAALAESSDVELIAIDVTDLPTGLLPRFRTSELLEGTKFAPTTDISLKRNLGILFAHMAGWRRIVFLDDDITVPEPVDLRVAAGLTDTYAGVGLAITGHPDNSVVCHAYRRAGGLQDVFIGGGALAVGRESMWSFFPAIYNEDWFFLLDSDGLRPTAVTGRVTQKPNDPFSSARARTEELGDCLAEGLFWLLDDGKSINDADATYWCESLRRRADFITEVLDMVSSQITDRYQRSKMLNSVLAARGRCLSISPELCEDYVHAWKADRNRWQRHLTQFQLIRRRGRQSHGPGEVLALLGLTPMAEHLPRQVPIAVGV